MCKQWDLTKFAQEGEDGTTYAEPRVYYSRNEGATTAPDSNHLVKRSHNVTFKDRTLHEKTKLPKPRTPIALHPWEDRAQSEAEITAFLLGIRQMAAAEVQGSLSTSKEARNIIIGSKLETRLENKMSLNPRALSPRKGPTSPRKSSVHSGSGLTEDREVPVRALLSAQPGCVFARNTSGSRFHHGFNSLKKRLNISQSRPESETRNGKHESGWNGRTSTNSIHWASYRQTTVNPWICHSETQLTDELRFAHVSVSALAPFHEKGHSLYTCSSYLN